MPEFFRARAVCMERAVYIMIRTFYAMGLYVCEDSIVCRA